MEIWKTVEGTDGKLEVSSMGRVKSNMRDGRILKTQIDKKGYHRLSVTINGVKHSYKLHRMVASAFLPNPDMLPQVNHIDGNKDNNAVDNLEWISGADNAKHAIEHGLWTNVFRASRETNEKRKRKVIAINISSGERKLFNSVGDAERFVGSRHISDVLKGKRQQAKGYRFEYAEGGDV